jgi:hypothetical protein
MTIYFWYFDGDDGDDGDVMKDVYRLAMMQHFDDGGDGDGNGRNSFLHRTLPTTCYKRWKKSTSQK